jgi:hypothetical protein
MVHFIFFMFGHIPDNGHDDIVLRDLLEAKILDFMGQM